MQLRLVYRAINRVHRGDGLFWLAHLSFEAISAPTATLTRRNRHGHRFRWGPSGTRSYLRSVHSSDIEGASVLLVNWLRVELHLILSLAAELVPAPYHGLVAGLLLGG